ncbi:MAG TPA: hypothetical protein VEY08_01115 [Chloroflexia bacterium]|nr:hypothetical protein [Chloroflexia bacterium]
MVAILLLVLVLAMQAQRQAPSGVSGPGPQAGSDAPRLAAPVGASSGEKGATVPDVPNTPAGENGVGVGRPVAPVHTRPLRDTKPVPPVAGDRVREMPELDPLDTSAPGAAVNDPVMQTSFSSEPLAAAAMPSPFLNFPGLTNVNRVYPPDTTGEAGPNHYFQWVNLSFQIFDKTTGASLYGPANGNTLWNSLGGTCAAQNAGDPVVLYDQFAGRWVVSQFTSSAPYGECVAVSATSDPLGSYHLYFFQHSTSVFYDYPHMGVWPDGYYTTFNKFKMPAGRYQGGAVVVYDRAKMLLGQPAGFQEVAVSTTYGTLQPADVDGDVLPPSGAANVLVARGGTTSLRFWKYSVNWSNPASSSFTGPTTVSVASYNQLCAGTRSCVPQPGTNVGLDGLGDRLMFRVAYRNFGTYQSLVLNHSVNAATSGTKAGIRWYEVRNPHGTPSIYQQGTYAPDTASRWMASAAQDNEGNIAVGYSVSSGSIYPSIRYTGRLATDPLNTLPQGEVNIISGSGSQTGTGYRWGDYSHMSIDPTDDCTFWYTTEYMPTTGTASWATQIASFKFAGCQR